MTDEAEKEIARLRTIIDCYAASSAAAAAELKRLRAEAHANWRDHIRPPDDFDRALAAATDEAWGINDTDRGDAEIACLRLTDAEREAVRDAAESFEYDDQDAECARVAVTLRGLLERTK